MVKLNLTLPDISVVIIQTRSNKLLNRAIASVKAQIYPEIEIVVVDNIGKTKSIGKCLNDGVRSCSNQWVMSIDDDDYINFKYVLNQALFLQKMLSINPHTVGVTSYVIRFMENTKEKRPFTKTPTGLYRRKFLLLEKFNEDLPKLVDTELVERLTRKGYKIYKDETCYGYYYRQSSDNVSGNKWNKGEK